MAMKTFIWHNIRQVFEFGSTNKISPVEFFSDSHTKGAFKYDFISNTKTLSNSFFNVWWSQ